ncbi:MAG: hypothetical protein HOE90_13975 [Bacteriovoracaceae bacterium]|jgi:hypothetical protein|nr:hypothetical protein [Bacteriovoracaceae bacterium]
MFKIVFVVAAFSVGLAYGSNYSKISCFDGGSEPILTVGQSGEKLQVGVNLEKGHRDIKGGDLSLSFGLETSEFEIADFKGEAVIKSFTARDKNYEVSFKLTYDDGYSVPVEQKSMTAQIKVSGKSNRIHDRFGLSNGALSCYQGDKFERGKVIDSISCLHPNGVIEYTSWVDNKTKKGVLEAYLTISPSGKSERMWVADVTASGNGDTFYFLSGDGFSLSMDFESHGGGEFVEESEINGKEVRTQVQCEVVSGLLF